MVYFGVVLVFVLVEFCLGIAAYAKKGNMDDIASQSWTLLYDSDRGAIEDIEVTFSCCGWSNVTDRAVPPLNTTDINYCIIKYPTFAGKPCTSAVVATLQASIAVAGGAAIAIALIQIISLLFSLYLFLKIPKQQTPRELVDEPVN